jgi:predicted nuclease of predicted toxin-antitoxin system
MPRSVAGVLREAGHTVQDVRDIALGSASDEEIIQYARASGAILITRDKDFGDVLRHPGHPGAIILRLPSTFTAKQIADHVALFLRIAPTESLVRSLVIVELDRFRRRPIP